MENNPIWQMILFSINPYFDIQGLCIKNRLCLQYSAVGTDDDSVFA